MLKLLIVIGRYMYKQKLKNLNSYLSIIIKNEHLDRKISNFEIEFVMKSIKNKKACGTDGIAGELIKYGGSGMSMMLRELFQLILESECIPECWGEKLIARSCALKQMLPKVL